LRGRKRPRAEPPCASSAEKTPPERFLRPRAGRLNRAGGRSALFAPPREPTPDERDCDLFVERTSGEVWPGTLVEHVVDRAHLNPVCSASALAPISEDREAELRPGIDPASVDRLVSPRGGTPTRELLTAGCHPSAPALAPSGSSGVDVGNGQSLGPLRCTLRPPRACVRKAGRT
jgi:hypothetical protein